MTDELRIPAAILGATGAVGQRFVARLASHPLFGVGPLVASDNKAGMAYADAAPWTLDAPMPEAVARRTMVGLEDFVASPGVRLAFSALPAGVAGPVETRLAAAGVRVFTNARDHRMDSLVPLLVPEVNADHLQLVARQPGPGWICGNGNCSSIILEMALAPLVRSFGVDEVHVTTMQGLSGAGYPGVSAIDIVDNIIPFVDGEEQKMAREVPKALGKLGPNGIEPLPIPIHATCTRAAVRDGHTESVHLRLSKPATPEAVAAALRMFRGPSMLQKLPSTPTRPIVVLEQRDRPQPRRDRDLGAGMSIAVGRIRLAENGRDLRMVILGHNTIRGAAGQAIQNAELAFTQGML